MSSLQCGQVFTPYNSYDHLYAELRRNVLATTSEETLTNKLSTQGQTLQSKIGEGLNQYLVDSSLESALQGLYRGYQQVQDVLAIQQNLNALSQPGINLKDKIQLLSLFIASLGEEGQQQYTCRLASHVFHQSLAGLDELHATHRFPVIPSLVGLLEYFQMTPQTGALPGAEAYLTKSPVRAVQTAYQSLKDDLRKFQERLDEIAQNEARAPNGNFDQQREPIIEKQQEALHQLAGLPFKEKIEVNPALVDELLEAIELEVKPQQTLLQTVKNNLRFCEQLLADSFQPEQAVAAKPRTFELLAGFGQGKQITWEPSAAALDELQKDDARQKVLVMAYHFTQQLVALEGEVEPRFHGLAAERQQEVRDSLWKLERKLDGGVLGYALCNVTAQTPGHSLFTPVNSLDAVTWLFDRVIRPNPLGLADYSKVFNSSGGYAPVLSNELIKVNNLLAQNKIDELSAKLGALIQDAASAKKPETILETLVLLDVVVRDGKLTARLKNQIPTLSLLSDITSHVQFASEEIVFALKTIALQLQKTLSKTLTDFYRADDDLVELFDAVDRIKIMANHPRIREGIDGHELVKSGIVLEGPPGVGKTYFMELLHQDTGYPLFTVSPEHGDVKDPAQMIEAIKNQVEAAKKYVTDNSAPCFLFFDEGETVSPKRRPDAEYQQALITGYVLQAVNELRKDYPLVIPVLATNYLDRLDEAMIRQGRFDIVVTLKKPSAELRAAIISDELQKELGDDLVLTEEQMQELVAITDNFNPLPLVRTIHEWNRVDPLLAADRHEEHQTTFESLRNKFQKERAAADRLAAKLKPQEAGQQTSPTSDIALL